MIDRLHYVIDIADFVIKGVTMVCPGALIGTVIGYTQDSLKLDVMDWVSTLAHCKIPHPKDYLYAYLSAHGSAERKYFGRETKFQYNGGI